LDQKNASLMTSVTSFADCPNLQCVGELRCASRDLADMLSAYRVGGTLALPNLVSGCLTDATICMLDWIAGRSQPSDNVAKHLLTGRRGEEAAYIYLRRYGYTMVARNFRSPNRRGEIDLIGWHNDILCFVEVKTRTSAMT
jgi:Uncharacterised protein family UPF0102